MVTLPQLWLPILLSAIVVFIASSIIHMVLKYHAGDFKQLPDEDAVRAALRVPPGDYSIPYAGSMEAMKDPVYAAKMEEGPVGFLTIVPTGSWNVGRNLGMWFVYCIVVSLVAAYITGRAIGPGADYLTVFRFAGTTAFAGYALALWQHVIWYGRSVGSTVRNTIDGLVYALLTAGVFGWLWPAF
jgi:hypothetical protein